jgi:hypothetical protein
MGVPSVSVTLPPMLPVPCAAAVPAAKLPDNAAIVSTAAAREQADDTPLVTVELVGMMPVSIPRGCGLGVPRLEVRRGAPPGLCDEAVASKPVPSVV